MKGSGRLCKAYPPCTLQKVWSRSMLFTNAMVSKKIFSMNVGCNKGHSLKPGMV